MNSPKARRSERFSPTPKTAMRLATVNLLKGAGSRHSLVEVVNYFIKNYQEAERESQLNEAVAEYLEERAKNVERSIIGTPEYDDIKSELNWFHTNFGEQFVPCLTTETLKTYLSNPCQSLKQRQSLQGFYL